MQINLFNFDSLAKIMIALVLFIGVIVGKFSINYMKGDKKHKSFFISLFLLINFLTLLFISDNLLLFIIFWILSNLILIKIMIHKSSWKAAKESGLLTAKTYFIGLFSIIISFALLYIVTGETSIKSIIEQKNNSTLIAVSLIFIMIAAMTQSAIWPFHKWLISSLNSPLPVSAIMHAGLVNGGGFLIIKFAPLYLNYPEILDLMFILGITTAIIGTLWKLIQSDIKRMLACSTMAQMGFMIAQCGLGLFSAAMVHIILHGIFKSYLFLSSSSAAQEKRLDMHYPPNITSFLCSLICGSFASYVFAFVSNHSFITLNTSIFLFSIAFIAGTGIALTILRKNILLRIPLALFVNFIAGALYGLNMNLVDSILCPVNLFHPQALNLFHIIGLVLFILLWLFVIFTKNIPKRLYVMALNSSQPHPKTITSHRNYYQY